MFSYPKKAEFNRVVPKAKIYAHARVSKRLKELFASQVGEIIWRYKLSPETTNLPARDGIREIQIFDLHLKSSEIDEAVLAAIDRAIPFPLVLRLIHGEILCSSVSFKRPSEADSTKWVIGGRFQTGPFSLHATLPDLPVALDLAGLYEHIVRPHIPLAAQNGEGLAAHVARFAAVSTKKKTLKTLEAKLAKEKQFNRKVEINQHLRSLAADLTALQSCSEPRKQ